MQKTETDWKTSINDNLLTVFTTIDDKLTMRAFLEDILTKREISEVGMRLEAARLLRDGEKYTNIITVTKLSSRTIARISNWLQKGRGGYKAALETLEVHR